MSEPTKLPDWAQEEWISGRTNEELDSIASNLSFGVNAMVSLGLVAEIKRLRAMLESHPRWTNKAPTEPGLYWFSLIDSSGVRRHCEVCEIDGILCMATRNLDESKNLPVTRPHRVWAGPLKPPVGEAAFSVTRPES